MRNALLTPLVLAIGMMFLGLTMVIAGYAAPAEDKSAETAAIASIQQTQTDSATIFNVSGAVIEDHSGRITREGLEALIKDGYTFSPSAKVVVPDKECVAKELGFWDSTPLECQTDSRFYRTALDPVTSYSSDGLFVDIGRNLIEIGNAFLIVGGIVLAGFFAVILSANFFFKGEQDS